MYSAVVVFIGVVVQFLVVESKQGHYNNVSLEATWFIDSNSTIEKGDVHFSETIYNSDNLTGNLPLERLMREVDIKFKDLASVLYENSFCGLRTVSLYLSHCNLTEIKPYAFNNSIVHALVLNTNLRKIEKHAFFNASVYILDFNLNNIEYIEPGAFEGIFLQSHAAYSIWPLDLVRIKDYFFLVDVMEDYVTIISLRGNQLETIQAGVFNNVNVEAIKLSYNKIKVLEPNAFTDTNALKWLSLEHNKIINITKNVFQSDKLAVLILASNNIELIEPQSFSRLPRIEIINLTKNNLKEIRRGIFCNLSARKLDLSENRITFIEHQAFEDLPNLTHLNLKNNYFTSLEENIFNKIPNIRYIIVNNDTIVSSNLQQYRSHT